METKSTDIITQNRVFLWVALAAALVLTVPLLAMQFTSEVSWTLFDFAVMGALLFGAGSIFVLAARVTPRKYRVLVGLSVLAAFVWLWAEGAVGIFTNWGS